VKLAAGAGPTQNRFGQLVKSTENKLEEHNPNKDLQKITTCREETECHS